MSKRRSELLIAREIDKAQRQKAEVRCFLIFFLNIFFNTLNHYCSWLHCIKTPSKFDCDKFFLSIINAQLEERLAASDKKREKTQAEIIAKQKKREEKAKKVRLRAKQMKDGDDVVGLDVDHDETYNADEEGILIY